MRIFMATAAYRPMLPSRILHTRTAMSPRGAGAHCVICRPPRGDEGACRGSTSDPALSAYPMQSAYQGLVQRTVILPDGPCSKGRSVSLPIVHAETPF